MLCPGPLAHLPLFQERLKMMKTTKHVRLQGKLKEMAASTVMMHIGEDRYASIKRQDEHPVFIGMLVAYEGPSTGQMETFDEHVTQADPKLLPIKWWSEAAVYELSYRMNMDSPKLTIGHDDPDARDEGDVLSGFIQTNPEQQGIPEAFGVAYVRSDKAKQGIKSGALDVVSVEADVVLLVGQQNQVEVETVTKVDAVALGNSEVMAPGFQRASVEAVITEFQDTIKGRVTMSKPIEEMSRNELLENETVSALIQTQNKAMYEDLRKERERADKAETRVTQLEGELTAASGKLKAAGAAVNKERIDTMVKAELKDAKLPEAQKVALQTKLRDTISVDDPDVSEEDLGATVKGAVASEVAFLSALNKEMKIDVEGKGSDETDEGKGEDEEEGKGDQDTGDDAFLTDNPIAEEKAT